MSTPGALKRDMLSGPAWDIVAGPLIPVRERLEATSASFRPGYAGDHLHAFTQKDAPPSKHCETHQDRLVQPLASSRLSLTSKMSSLP